MEMIDNQQPYKIYRHKIGSSRDSDEFLLTPSNPKNVASVYDARYGGVTFFSEGDFYATHSLKIKKIGSKKEPKEIYSSKKYRAYAYALEDKIYIFTNHEAPNFKMMVTDKDKPEFENWKDLYPEGETVLESYSITPKYLIIQDKKDVVSRVKLYDLDGKLLKSSVTSFLMEDTPARLPQYILDAVANAPDKHYLEAFEENGEDYQSSYSYLTDLNFKPLAVLNIPYIEDENLINKELKEFLTRLGLAYLFMIILAIVLAYVLSKFITRSLQTLSKKITETRLGKRNEKIELSKNTTQELSNLVKAYNSMIDELESSAAKLAASEREAAWREMAKQVAHEIKNPLTPMRLSLQSFQRNFNPSDPNIQQKLEEFSKTLIQQIDTMSAIASAFSTYAQMPAQKDETLDVVTITKLALEIFTEPYISFHPKSETIIIQFDRSQLIRVITNLVKHSIHAIEKKMPEKQSVQVAVFEKQNEVYLTVTDNGIGIPPHLTAQVFEPKFTTKTSGMGLGLGMVKTIVETYKGSIEFTSTTGKGTVFTVRIPPISKHKSVVA